jgi:hypothetical protein
MFGWDGGKDMSSPYGDEELDDEDEFYPVDADAIHRVSDVTKLIRRNLYRLGPKDLKAAAVALLGLERLPRVTPGASVVFGFRTPSNNGNWAWADISIGDEGVFLGVGEHFYEPGVGGDTESRTLFEIHYGGYKGSIQEWLEVASNLFQSGVPESDDNSDHESIDWTV